MAFKPKAKHLFVGLNLYLEKDGDEFVVTLEGDQAKEIYSGPLELDAQRVFKETLDHYAEREKAEKDLPNEYRQYPLRTV